jgi:hypothetical protein
MQRWWAGLVMMACVRVAPVPPPPPPRIAPPPPPPIHVPEGCLANASGAYRPTTTSPLRYEASDDGGTLVMVAFSDTPVDAGRPGRRFSRDGGLPWLVKTQTPQVPAIAPPPSPLATLVVTRTPDGFVGAVTVGAGPDAGCVPTFAARVVACSDEGLTLETMPSARFDSSCRPLDGGAMARQVLQRLGRDAGAEADNEALSPDASRPDAG